MKYINSGNSDLRVSCICMGCMGLGMPQSGSTDVSGSFGRCGKRGKSAAGRLSGRLGETSKRLMEDSYAKFKYDAMADEDGKIIIRIAEHADKHQVSMTEISLAWLLTKAESPVVGATKLSHMEGAAKAAELMLAPEEMHGALPDRWFSHLAVEVPGENGSNEWSEPVDDEMYGKSVSR